MAFGSAGAHFLNEAARDRRRQFYRFVRHRPQACRRIEPVGL
jgi:hypothetical protein